MTASTSGVSRLFNCLVLGLAILPCQFSSAQETDNSNKLLEKPASKKKEPLIVRGRFDDKRIVESSGIATARPNADGLDSNSIWTFNDSGGDSILFRVNLSGRTEATLKLKKIRNRDWETMCSFSIGEKQFLAVGDVGDNSFNRKSCQIYVIDEPVIKPSKPKKKKKAKIRDLDCKVDTIDFRYEDGAHNCEAMSYNAEDNSFWLIEKVYVDDTRKTAPGIYVLPNPLLAKASDQKEKQNNVAKRIADFPVRNVTGMAFSPNGQRLVVRNYFGAWLYEKLENKTWQETVKESKPSILALPLQSQGEAICFTTDSDSLLVTSEMKNAIIWQVSLDQKSKKE